VLGRLERVSFPNWNLYGLDAKIDTGAFTSSLHCHHIEMDHDQESVSFYLLDPGHPEYEKRKFRSRIRDIRSIRSSNGQIEDRVIIATKMELGGTLYPVELSLTDRTDMKYPVLIGRRFLRRRFVVDVSRSYITEKQMNRGE